MTGRDRSPAGRVIYRIGDRGSCSNDTDLAKAPDAERRYFAVGLIHEDHLNIRHVSMDRHVVFATIVVHEIDAALCRRTLLLQGHSKALTTPPRIWLRAV